MIAAMPFAISIAPSPNRAAPAPKAINAAAIERITAANAKIAGVAKDSPVPNIPTTAVSATMIPIKTPMTIATCVSLSAGICASIVIEAAKIATAPAKAIIITEIPSDAIADMF